MVAANVNGLPMSPNTGNNPDNSHSLAAQPQRLSKGRPVRRDLCCGSKAVCQASLWPPEIAVARNATAFVDNRRLPLDGRIDRYR